MVDLRLASLLLFGASALAPADVARPTVARARMTMIADAESVRNVAASPRLVSTASVQVGKSTPSVPETPVVRAMPEALSSVEIARRLASDPESLGSLSIGSPSRGALFNGVRMPSSGPWRVIDPARAFGTEETIASIMTAIEHVDEAFPGSPPLYVGNISAERGGYLRPHRSHQSGRDADLGYYYAGEAAWYARANAKNLDLPRTWELVKTLASDPNVEAMFMDRSVQILLRGHALRAGESVALVARIFDGERSRGVLPIALHEWGHLTHVHVRFRSPIATGGGVKARREVESLARSRQAGPRARWKAG